MISPAYAVSRVSYDGAYSVSIQYTINRISTMMMYDVGYASLSCSMKIFNQRYRRGYGYGV